MTKKEYENAVRILDAMEPVIDLIKHSHVLHYLQDLGLEVACFEAKNRIFADDPRNGLKDDQWLKEINYEMTEKEYNSACKIIRALFPLIDEHAEPELSEYFGGLIDRAIEYQKKHDNFEDQLKEDGIYDEINGMSKEELLEAYAEQMTEADFIEESEENNMILEANLFNGDKPTVQASIKLADSERGFQAVDSFFEDLAVLIKKRASEND